VYIVLLDARAIITGAIPQCVDSFRKETNRMIKKVMMLGLGISVAALMMAPPALARQTVSNKTVLTFSQPVEIPGRILPAGTYTFKLLDSMSDRHIVQIFNADGSEIITTVMAIPDYRLEATDQTVIKFREMPAGQPEALRAWFYPGNLTGQEFVYPKARAAQLARITKAPVPALAVDMTDVNAMKAAPIIAITADEKEVPVAAAIQITPAPRATASAGTVAARELPHTASPLVAVTVMGLGALGFGFVMLQYRRRLLTQPAR